jgi:hypothetical protein
MAKKKMVEVLFVPVSGDVVSREIADDDLKTMQAMVGGYIEPVRLNRESTLFVNEEGLLMGLKLNPRLSLLADRPLVGNGFIEKPTPEILEAFKGYSVAL